MKHILLKELFLFKKRKKIEPPQDFSYNKILGAWINSNENTLLVFNEKFPLVGTKKKDIETGEDEKG